MTDPEGSAVTVTATYSGGSLPSFITFTGGTFTMNPVSGQAGTYPITLQLKDEVNSPSSTFSVIVTVPGNQPPSFASTLTGQTVIAGISSTFTLPGATDPES